MDDRESEEQVTNTSAGIGQERAEADSPLVVRGSLRRLIVGDEDIPVDVRVRAGAHPAACD